MNRRYLIHLGVIGLYLLLTLGLTWPLAPHLLTHVPGEATWAFDEYTFIWNMWWLKFSLLILRQSPLESGYTFFPLGIHLTTYTFNLFNAAFGLPLQLGLSLPLASNLTLIFSYVSSAYGTFLLVLYLLAGQPCRFSNRSLGTGKVGVNNSAPSYLAATLAGAVFAFSASRMMYVALGHYNFVTIQWFPFYALFLLKTLRQGGRKVIFLAGLFAAFCLYAELTYSVFLLFITLLLWLGEGLRRREGLSPEPGGETVHAPSLPYPHKSLTFISRDLIRLGLLALVTFVLTAPFILAVLPDFLDPAYAEPGWGEGLKLSADLAGLVSLTPLHPLAGLDWVAELRAVTAGTSRFSDANTLFVGYGILALALLGFIARRRVTAIWLGSALIFALLSLGPLLTLNGQNRFNLDGLEVTFPLPFALLHYIPILNANRVPNRFGIPLTLALAVLAGYGLAWLNERVSRGITLKPGVRNVFPILNSGVRNAFRTPEFRFTLPLLLLSFLLLILLLFDQYSVPLPLTDARVPEVYAQIGAEPDEFTLLQLPLGWRNSYGMLGAERTQLQYYQSAHQRPILGGNTSRNPQFKFDYYAGIPLFVALAQTEAYQSVDDITLTQARQQAAELMTLYNIKYLAIHEPIPFRRPYEDTFTATRTLALELIPHQAEPVYESSGVQVFAVQPAEIPDPLTLDFGDWRSDPYRGEGWAENEETFAATANWATAPEAELFFPTRGQGDRQITLQIAPFYYPGSPEQRVSFSLNGQSLAQEVSLHERWQVVELTLPEAALRSGLNRLVLHFAHLAQPRQVLPAQVAVGQTGVETPIDLEVNSGADFAFMTVGFGGEALDASAHRRGINLAVIQPESGELLAVKGFDTAANEFEATALEQFIETIPEGQIVIVASQGPEATAFFRPETLAALQSLGLAIEALTPPFSAIGIKGAVPGTALQAGGVGTAYLRLGHNADTRSLAAAVDWVRIGRPGVE